MKTQLLIATAVLTLLAGCASGVTRDTRTPPAQRAAERYLPYAGDPVDRFTSFRIDGWTPVSRTQLVVWARFNEAYLLTVWDACQDLMWTNTIRIDHTGPTVTKFDSVLVGRERCQITDIRPVDIGQMRADERAKADAAKAAAP